MKKRYIYTILFALPGLFISIITGVALTGIATGFFWIFVFGDSPWSISEEIIMVVAMTIGFLVTWISCIAFGFSVGKRLESKQANTAVHLVISLAITIPLFLCIAFYYFGYQKEFSQSDIGKCSAFCEKSGYSGASVAPAYEEQPKTCGCTDNSGQTTLIVPFDDILK